MGARAALCIRPLRPRLLTARVVEEDLVVEAQAQLGHAREEDPHLDGAHDLTAQDVAIGADLRGRAGREGRLRLAGCCPPPCCLTLLATPILSSLLTVS